MAGGIVAGVAAAGLLVLAGGEAMANCRTGAGSGFCWSQGGNGSGSGYFYGNTYPLPLRQDSDIIVNPRQYGYPLPLRQGSDIVVNPRQHGYPLPLRQESDMVPGRR